jgi:phage terminase large subunit GpA-like protein
MTKDDKEKNKLHFEPPIQCPHCGRSRDELKEECDGAAFIQWQLPGTSFVFYQCPICNCLVGNIHAFANTKKVMEMQKSRSSIIQGPGSKIVISKGFNPKLN